MKKMTKLMVASVVIAGAAISYRAISIARDPHTPVLRSLVPEFPVERNPQSSLSVGYHDSAARLYNGIARLSPSRWSDEDRSWLVSTLRSPRLDPPDGDLDPVVGSDGLTQSEAYMAQNEATSIVAHHIMLGTPVPDGVREAFEDAVEQTIHHDHPKVRVYAVAAIFDAGMLDDPYWHALVEDVKLNDPSPVLRDQADRFLLVHQGVEVSGDPSETFGGCASCD